VASTNAYESEARPPITSEISLDREKITTENEGGKAEPE